MGHDSSDSRAIQRLLDQVRGGDRQAFDQLFAMHRSELRKMIDLRLDSKLRSRVDASDVVQEAWLAIVRGLRRLDDPTRFRPWALRIVTNKCADWTRRQQRQRRIVRSVATKTSSTTGAAGAPSFAQRKRGEDRKSVV